MVITFTLLVVSNLYTTSTKTGQIKSSQPSVHLLLDETCHWHIIATSIAWLQHPVQHLALLDDAALGNGLDID